MSLVVGLEKFDAWPLIDVLDKMIRMLNNPPRPKDREAGSLIDRKLQKQKKAIKLIWLVAKIMWRLARNGF